MRPRQSPYALKLRPITVSLLLLLLPLFLPHPTPAATRTWLATTNPSPWSDPANWSGNVVPTYPDTAQINNGGTAEFSIGIAKVGSLEIAANPGDSGSLSLTGGQLTASMVNVGYRGTGSVLHSAGKLTGSSFYIDTGSYNLTGAAELVCDNEFIGRAGHGRFIQSGGTNSTSSLNVGVPTDTSFMSSGVYDLTAGELRVSGTANIGVQGHGTFNQSGGAVRLTYSSLYVGNSVNDGAGIYRLSGDAFLSAYYFYVGGVGTGTVDHASGAVSASNLYVAKGSYSMGPGATLTVRNLSVNKSGFFNQNGGTNHVESSFSVANVSSAPYVPGGGTYSMSAGQLTIGGALSVASATFTLGTFRQTGGSVATGTNSLYLAQGGSSSAVYSLSAGSLSTAAQYIGHTGTASLDQTGGVNRANGNLYIGFQSNASGSYSLAGTAQLFTSTQYHANGTSARSTFTQSGGTNSLGTNPLYLAYGTTSASSYVLSSGNLFSGHQYIGHAGAATFTQTGGVNDLGASHLYLANNSTSVSSYTLSDGTLLAAYQFIGHSGSGTFTHTGGTNNVTGTLSLGTNLSSSRGVYLLAGPAATLLTGAQDIGFAGPSLFRQTAGTNFTRTLTIYSKSRYELAGGSLTVTQSLTNSGTLDLAASASAESLTNYGSLNLLAGTLATPAITNNGSLNLAGGSLRSAGSSPSLVSLTGTGSTSVSHGVTLDVASLRQNALTLAGDARVSNALFASRLSSLTITPTGSLNLTVNPLILDYSAANPTDEIRDYLLTGQLYSSTPNGQSLAYFIAGDLGISTFLNLPVDPTTLLIKLALPGDTNADNTINLDDYAAVDRGLARGGSTWSQGDFNYDGQVTGADYLFLDAAFARQQGGQLSPTLLSQRESQFGPAYLAALTTAIPEPHLPLASLLCHVPSLLLFRRRPSKSCCQRETR